MCIGRKIKDTKNVLNKSFGVSKAFYKDINAKMHPVSYLNTSLSCQSVTWFDARVMDTDKWWEGSYFVSCIYSKNSDNMKEDHSVLSSKLGGGPMGLGDPNDRSLRKVERNVMIPKLVRERIKSDKCANEVKEFHDCCLASGLLHVVKCRRENDTMKTCMEKWFYNQDFIKECTEQYLDERSEFRKTGVPNKRRNIKLQGM